MTESRSGDSPTPSGRPGVGLVVVSHSRTLARSAVALAAEMLHGRPLRIEVAAGLDDTTFGTDAVAIMEAIERADGPAGVVVLMDLGSAVLSTELALDLLQDPSIRDRVTLSPAPLVEGLIVAAVAAAGGASRAEVAAEARDALMGKSGHLSTLRRPAPHPTRATSARRRSSASSRSRTPTACTPGRPPGSSARSVRSTRRSSCATSPRAARPVPAGSLSRVATLAALRGHEVEVRASGPQAQEAVEHLLTLAARRFDETVEESRRASGPGRGPHRPAARCPPHPGSRSARFAGSPRCPSTSTRSRWGSRPRSGDASWSPWPPCAATSSTSGSSPPARWAPEQASIFDAHLSLLTDAEMLADVKARTSTGIGAVAAWAGCLADVEREWASLPDPYLQGAGRGRPRGRRPGAAGADGRARPADDRRTGSWWPAT